MPNVLASVIIPVYNEEKTIEKTLMALINQSIQGIEIIVIDDGSTDTTPDIVRKYSSIKYVYQKNMGPARARNNGAEMATSQIILFTDADCIPEVDWVERMLEAFKDDSVVAVAGEYISRQHELVARYAQLEYLERYRRMQMFMEKEGMIDFISTYSAGYRRDVFLKFNGFDIMYKNAAVEDHELSFRIYDRGLKMVLKRDALVSHEHPTSVTDYMKRKFNVAFWKYLVLKSHPDKIKSDSNTPQILKIQIALGGIFLISLVLSFISVFINIPISLLLSSLGFFFLFLHIALSCPFYKESLKYDRKVALIIPFMDLVRSISFFIGFSSSLFKMLLVRKR